MLYGKKMEVCIQKVSFYGCYSHKSLVVFINCASIYMYVNYTPGANQVSKQDEKKTQFSPCIFATLAIQHGGR